MSTQTPERTLQVRELCKRWGSRVVLDRVSFACGPGDVVVVLGDNGAGKSTLLKIVAGLLGAESGTVTVGGEPVRPGQVGGRRHLGVWPDHADLLPELGVGELVTLTATLKGAGAEPSSDEWRDTLGLGPLWHQRLGTLSFGQRKRALLMTALIGAPWLLVMDEPSNGLDPEALASVQELLRRRRARGDAALIATNDLAFVAFARTLDARVFRLHAAKLAPVSGSS